MRYAWVLNVFIHWSISPYRSQYETFPFWSVGNAYILVVLDPAPCFPMRLGPRITRGRPAIARNLNQSGFHFTTVSLLVGAQWVAELFPSLVLLPRCQRLGGRRFKIRLLFRFNHAFTIALCFTPLRNVRHRMRPSSISVSAVCRW